MSHCAGRPEETLKLRSSHVPVPISQREVSETCPARAGRGLLKFSAHPQECRAGMDVLVELLVL